MNQLVDEREDTSRTDCLWGLLRLQERGSAQCKVHVLFPLQQKDVCSQRFGRQGYLSLRQSVSKISTRRMGHSRVVTVFC